MLGELGAAVRAMREAARLLDAVGGSEARAKASECRAKAEELERELNRRAEEAHAKVREKWERMQGPRVDPDEVVRRAEKAVREHGPAKTVSDDELVRRLEALRKDVGVSAAAAATANANAKGGPGPPPPVPPRVPVAPPPGPVLPPSLDPELASALDQLPGDFVASVVEELSASQARQRAPLTAEQQALLAGISNPRERAEVERLLREPDSPGADA